MQTIRKPIAVMTLTLAAVWAARGVEAAVPPATTVNHAISGQGKLAVSWNAIPGSQIYKLWVLDSEGVKVYTNISPAAAGCGAGTGVCSVFSDVTLVPGPFRTFIGGWNPDGWGPWSPQYDAMAGVLVPRVVDQNNKFVGTLVDPQRIFFILNGRVTETAVIRHRIYLLQQPQLLFTSNNCTGQKYGIAALPDRLVFNNTLVNGWLLSGASTQITVESSGSIDSVTNLVTGCNDDAPYSETVQQINPFNGTALFGSLVNPLKVVQ